MAPNYPTTYDDEQSTFGDLEDLIVLTLDATAHPSGINASETSLTFTETSLVDRLNLYTELIFEGDDGTGTVDDFGNIEGVRITAKGAGGSGQVTVTRGWVGVAQTHAAGAVATQDPSAVHFNKLRDALIAAQKYKGLVGLDAGLPATCSPGEMYIATDTSTVYVCFVANVWKEFNLFDHGDYAGLGSDDHTQYHTETRKSEWHDNQGGYSQTPSGDHLTNATTHDHSGAAGFGNSLRKFRTGLDANRGTPTTAGEVYYGYDQNNLYFSPDGLNWKRYTAMPEGVTAFFDLDSCPSGWTQVSLLDGKFVKGVAISGTPTSGGSATHTHTMPDLVSHTHTVAAQTGITTANGGSHGHTFKIRTGSGVGTGAWENTATNSAQGWIMDNKSMHGSPPHNSITKPAHNTDNAGVATPNTNSQNNEPPYHQLIVCRKD